MSKWPPSNYPVLMALILLVITAIELMLGESETFVNQLVIYAYLLIVIGITVRFFEFILPETLIWRLRSKLHQSRSGEILKSGNESRLDFFADVTKNVLFSLIFFLIIVIGYGALVDWSFAEKFLKQLEYVTVIFFVLHIIFRVGL